MRLSWIPELTFPRAPGSKRLATPKAPPRCVSLRIGMRLSSALRTGLPITLVVVGVLCARAQTQDAPAQDAAAKDAPANESKGLPPRATPGDYQAHTQAGTVTLRAHFLG